MFVEVDAAFLVQMYCAFSKKLCLQGWNIDILRRLFIFCVIFNEISSNFIKAVQNIRSCVPECHNIDLSVDNDTVAKVLCKLSFHMLSTVYVAAFFALISLFLHKITDGFLFIVIYF